MPDAPLPAFAANSPGSKIAFINFNIPDKRLGFLNGHINYPVTKQGENPLNGIAVDRTQIGCRCGRDFSLTYLPVDLCADLVVRISLNSPADPGIFHLTPFAPFHWSEICEAASNHVHNLEHLPPLEWYHHIKKCALTHRELFPVVALLAQDPSLMQFRSNIYRLRFDISNLTPYLGKAPAFPQNRSTYLRRYMESVAKI